jgi:hypothetical protein
MIMTARDLPDFFAGSLRKVFVPLANSKELFRHNHRRDVIGGTTDFIIGRAYKRDEYLAISEGVDSPISRKALSSTVHGPGCNPTNRAGAAGGIP